MKLRFYTLGWNIAALQAWVFLWAGCRITVRCILFRANASTARAIHGRASGGFVASRLPAVAPARIAHACFGGRGTPGYNIGRPYRDFLQSGLLTQVGKQGLSLQFSLSGLERSTRQRLPNDNEGMTLRA